MIRFLWYYLGNHKNDMELHEEPHHRNMRPQTPEELEGYDEEIDHGIAVEARVNELHSYSPGQLETLDFEPEIDTVTADALAILEARSEDFDVEDIMAEVREDIEDIEDTQFDNFDEGLFH